MVEEGKKFRMKITRWIIVTLVIFGLAACSGGGVLPLPGTTKTSSLPTAQVIVTPAPDANAAEAIGRLGEDGRGRRASGPSPCLLIVRAHKPRRRLIRFTVGNRRASAHVGILPSADSRYSCVCMRRR